MMLASPSVRAAWIVLPSGPGRRTRTSASSTFSQNSIAASGSRHTSVGITLGDVSGIGFTMADSSRLLRLQATCFVGTEFSPQSTFRYLIINLAGVGSHQNGRYAMSTEAQEPRIVK